jgi:hypothetical protein
VVADEEGISPRGVESMTGEERQRKRRGKRKLSHQQLLLVLSASVGSRSGSAYGSDSRPVCGRCIEMCVGDRWVDVFDDPHLSLFVV